MLNNLKYFSMLTVVVFLAGFFYIIAFPNNFHKEESNLPETFSKLKDGDIYTVNVNGEDLNLGIAKSVEARIQGLMGVNELDHNYGMLFLFEDLAPRTFHMRNVYVSLDMIFLNENFEIVKIHSNTKTNQGEELYSSEGRAQYVIELEAGAAERLGLSEGDILDISQ